MRHILVLGLAALLPACQTFSPDGGMSVVADVTSQTLKKDVALLRTPEDAALVTAKVKGLLKRRLTADAAVQVALLNNRGLQAAYNELGMAEAAMVQGSLPPNPTFSVERLSGPAEIEIEKRIVANILALATLPARADIAAGRFLQAQLAASEQTLRVAAETRRAYYRAVAAQEQVGLSSRPNRRLRPRRPWPSVSARPARSTSSTRRASRCSTPKSPRSSHPPGNVRPASASGSSDRWGFGAPTLVSRSRTACRRCRARPRSLPADRSRCGAAPGRSADRAHRAAVAREVLRAHRRRRVSSTCSRSPASRKPRSERPAAKCAASAASSSNSRSRSSISARCGCGRPSRATCRRSTG